MNSIRPMGHYYGNIVRKLFIAGALLMLVTLPLLQAFIPLPVFLAIIIILVVVLAAGFIVPTRPWTMIVDMIIAGGALLAFENYAVQSYFNNDLSFFFANQALALIFLVAFYYAIKTVRGAFMSDKPDA